MESAAFSPTIAGRIKLAAPAACFVIGIYAPSSISGVYSSSMWIGQSAALVVLLSFLALRPATVGLLTIANSVGLVTAILAGTILSPYSEYRWGGLLGYLLLALIYVVELKEIDAHRSLRALLLCANVVNLAIGVAMIWGVGVVQAFVVAHYSAFYPELVETMTTLRKPVLTFGTHSVAALFFYLFFWLNLESFKVLHRHRDLSFAVGYIVLGFALLSVSGIVLMSCATLQLLTLAYRRKPAVAITISITLLFACWFAYQHFYDEVEDVQQAGLMASDILMSPTNGFSGRFSELGTLYSTVQYLRANPFRPIGISYRSDLFFGDCGPVEHYLRGSFVLIITVYGGLYSFLRRNLLSRGMALHFFLVLVFFELGYTTLTYIRFLYLLPVMVVYLNHLHRSRYIPTGAQLL